MFKNLDFSLLTSREEAASFKYHCVNVYTSTLSITEPKCWFTSHQNNPKSLHLLYKKHKPSIWKNFFLNQKRKICYCNKLHNKGMKKEMPWFHTLSRNIQSKVQCILWHVTLWWYKQAGVCGHSHVCEGMFIPHTYQMMQTYSVPYAHTQLFFKFLSFFIIKMGHIRVPLKHTFPPT